MHFQTLTGEWQFRQAGAAEWLSAQVPGSVHTDLLAVGRIPDPFVADNEKRVQWVAQSDWEYRRTFTVEADVLAEERVFLVCDGLDTLAEVSLNGERLGQTDNMFRQYRWGVRAFLHDGDNELIILFRSPVQYVAARQAERPMHGVAQAIPGGPYLRKAPCQFGWDWGPQLPPSGIWKDIRLEGRSIARLDDLHLRQHHEGDQVTIEATLTVERWGDAALTARMCVTDPEGAVLEAQADVADGPQTLQVPIARPKLWWPNGYGDQPLYSVDVLLTTPGQVHDKRTYQMGLRTVELRQEDDEWGRSFTFVVNGVPIFAKGADWIPADSFPTRLSAERLEGLIQSAVAAHQNMLRVWGGGFYEEERFYDLCDHYGILVWQDFIFSCSVYPLHDAAFLENVRAEAIENIRRLRHRASLALWCGNNEMEWGWVEWGWSLTELQDLKAAYDQFFHHILPELCAAEDPDHPYWPSSPSSGGGFQDPNGQERGNTHYWDVWHGRKPFTAYRDQFPRFMSEFGFQSLSPLQTIRTYADEADWNMTSYIMEHHQRSAGGNGLIIAQMADTFRMPRDFESLVYLSMVLQAEGIRYGVEHWRRNMHRVSGTLYWQLNDCWPVASWSSLDYFGRWKALHYAARRFYAPVLLSIEDDPPRMGLHVTSDLTEPWHGTVHWSLETLAGEVLEAGQEAVVAPPLTSTHVCTLDFGERISDPSAGSGQAPSAGSGQAPSAGSGQAPSGGTPGPGQASGQAPSTGRRTGHARDVVLVCELRQGDSRIALSVATFVPNKHLSLTDPALTADVRLSGDQLMVEVTAQSLARFVELALADVDVVFSDNYFDIPAGRTVIVTCPLPEGWTVDQARAALRVRSLHDSF